MHAFLVGNSFCNDFFSSQTQDLDSKKPLACMIYFSLFCCAAINFWKLPTPLPPEKKKQWLGGGRAPSTMLKLDKKGERGKKEDCYQFNIKFFTVLLVF